jgi:hypothetical protein
MRELRKGCVRHSIFETEILQDPLHAVKMNGEIKTDASEISAYASKTYFAAMPSRTPTVVVTVPCVR